MSDGTTYGRAYNRGDFWPNKKCKTTPWAGETTPLTDALWSDEDGEAYVTMDFASNLERRMRAAERLLTQTRRYLPETGPRKEVDAHLEAARKEDGR